MAGNANDRLNIPHSPACGQWETLLVDALDGVLRPEDEAVFSNHMATCPSCTEMFEQARRGREWLEFLAPEPVVPAALLDRILVETGHSQIAPQNLAVAGGIETGNVLVMPPVWQRRGFLANVRRFAEPRLLMTAAMAFFSIALTLSLTGVRFSPISLSDLRPGSIRSQLEKRVMTASTPLIRYYDHLRFVYEVESRVKEIRRSTQDEQKNQQNQQQNQPASAPEGETQKKDGGTQLNPSEAPQQTVNPPDSRWSGDPLEARLEIPARPQSSTNQYPLHQNQGYPTPTDTSAFLETSGLAIPDRSRLCNA